VCDYCDCRSHPQIAALSTDHERLLELLGALDRAVSDGARVVARALLSELHDLLDRHARQEERGVFAQLRAADVGDGYVAGFEADHDVIHHLLAAGDDDSWRETATALVGTLRDHILREESDLFPAAHQLLTPTQWDAVDDQLALADT
jgi:hemerythrin-like domain-containing protein